MNVKKTIKPLIFISAICLFVFLITTLTTSEKSTAANQPARNGLKTDSSQKEESLYDIMRLDSAGLSREAFQNALLGFQHLEETGRIKNPDILSIVDFSLPSTKKRLFVIDLKNRLLLFNTLVSHGRNSGKDIANTFSNKMNSFKSSLGFYITGDTYNGEHGLSLRLEGEEAGINDNALSRGIVMHSADYVNESLGKAQGYIGRSLGCPAIPIDIHRKVIQRIQNGTCLFLYSPDKYYSAHTKILRHDSTAS
ncbi:murein L,D-transpeptidase catalytic domain family protein [Chitinophaga polysaccharea]|uniref:murein L,D-transpeptidase catalytic domain family protein n=1 Tax=Chitinophaga TaxID=79328 RepID=UPI001455852F|nr:MULTISPECIES: murein L,D-transpeptidase catalytic domain family protein [Chitinophaga]NLR61358.1 murein L,D-transpeptidase catalytic domain family protein [Chitinophaga polysaccharea]NLU95193.1 murein L,D-transpeptidase catalytic domain family protein [Chitinophaga sp. Ak27]